MKVKRGLLLGLGLTLCAALPIAAAKPLPELHVLASYDVPAGPSAPSDVRWASDSSVFLSRIHDGVFELALELGLPVRRQVFPNSEMFRFRSFFQLAASNDTLVVSGPIRGLAWRQLTKPAEGFVRFDRWAEAEHQAAIDVQGDRLLFLGAPRQRPGDPQAGVNGVAWVGSLSKGLTDLRPLLADPEPMDLSGGGKSSPHLGNCLFQFLGATRFLKDGSMLVAPGFLPGIYLYGPAGELLRTWNTALLGLDADVQCHTMSEDRRWLLAGSWEERHREVNRHRVVDAILPLPQGPGLLIRSHAGNRPSWELDILTAGGVLSYGVPVTADRPNDRLHADVRNGSIVLLVAGPAESEKLSGKLFVMELPR